MRIAVCDDEKVIKDIVVEHLNAFFKNTGVQEKIYIDTFSGAFEMLDYMERNKKKYDVIFMDIMLGKDNGIKLSEKILAIHQNVQIIFITGYIDYVEDIFDIAPTGLLIKPISYEKIKKVMEKVNKNISNNEKYITVNNKDGIQVIHTNEINYIESQGRYLLIKRKSGELIKVIMTISEMEQMLNTDFVKCHRSYIVNCRKIRRLDKRAIYLSDGQDIPVSSGNYENVRKRYINILEE